MDFDIPRHLLFKISLLPFIIDLVSHCITIYKRRNDSDIGWFP